MLLKTITKSDYQEVDRVIREAFSKSDYGYGGEAELVEKIRLEKHYDVTLEIIAIEDDQIVGHGLLSQVTVSSKQGLALAPLCVHPEHQGHTIGGQLLIELEARARQLDYPFISILGSPSYYSRFGYLPASQFNISPPFDVPEEAFMIKALTPNGLNGLSGTLIYSKAFED